MASDRVAGWPRARRLRRPAEFSAVQSAPARGVWRLAGASWALAALPTTDGATAARAPMRVGITVARRYAKRAVDRSLVKRIAREAARAAAPRIDALLAASASQLDVVLRLKAPWQREPAASLPARRRELRDDADRLFEELARRLERSAPQIAPRTQVKQ